MRLEHSVIGDLDASHAALTALDPLKTCWTKERAGNRVRIREVEAHRADFQRALRPPVEGFTPHEAIDVVRRSLPREGVLAFREKRKPQWKGR